MRHNRTNNRTNISAPNNKIQQLEQRKQQKLLKHIHSLLSKIPTDVAGLRKTAITEGLVNNSIRQIVWPYFLNVPFGKKIPTGTLEHKESKIVKLDVERSLWSFAGIQFSLKDSKKKRVRLERIINAVLSEHSGDLNYYQGYHDIASVLFLVCDPADSISYSLLDTLSMTTIKHYMEPNLSEVMKELDLLLPLINKMDKKVYDFLFRSGISGSSIISWTITWFAHHLSSNPNPNLLPRLFDFFIAINHPFVPLYLSAQIIVHYGAELEKTDCDFASLHGWISSLLYRSDTPWENLLSNTVSFFVLFPPTSLLRQASTLTNSKSQLSFLHLRDWKLSFAAVVLVLMVAVFFSIRFETVKLPIPKKSI